MAVLLLIELNIRETWPYVNSGARVSVLPETTDLDLLFQVTKLLSVSMFGVSTDLLSIRLWNSPVKFLLSSSAALACRVNPTSANLF